MRNFSERVVLCPDEKRRKFVRRDNIDAESQTLNENFLLDVFLTLCILRTVTARVNCIYDKGYFMFHFDHRMVVRHSAPE